MPCRLYHLVLPALSASYPRVRGTLAIHYSPVRHCVLLHPCDLHVLATPPAFRLSQDQTLQLNFLARVDPDAPCGPCDGLTETDTFTTRVYPRNEFVQTDSI